MLNRMVNWIVLICFFSVYAIPPANVMAGPSAPSYEQALGQFERYVDLLKELRSHLDRRQVDVAALLDSLNYEFDEIIDYVSSEIEFEQYAGTLRGAEGTLRSGAGNSLDQSILLAMLLKDAGADARVVRGRLSTELAAGLVESMGGAKSKASPYADKGGFHKTLREMWMLTGEPEKDFNAIALVATVKESPEVSREQEITHQETNFILSALRAARVPLGDSSTLESIIEEARDYFWVEYRESATAEWLRVDPAFARPHPELLAIAALQTFADRIPAELHHGFRFEVFVEQGLGGKHKDRRLFGPWERPTANLNDLTITFSTIPMSFMAQRATEEIAIPTDRNEIFVPMFMGSPTDLAFDLLGNVVPMDAAASSFAALFATESEKVSRAVNSLGELGSDQSSAKPAVSGLTALKFKITFIEPNGVERIYWRTAFSKDDLAQGHKADIRKSMFRSLTTTYSMLIATGGRNPAAALDASLKQIEGKEGLIKAALAQSFGAQLSSTQGNRAEVSWIGLGPTFALFDSYDSLAQFDTYRHSPSLLVYRSSLPFDGRIQVGTDIVQSKRRLRNPAAANTKEALRSVIEYGVWESVTEGLLLVGELPQGTHQAFAEYRQKGMTFQVLTPELEATLAGLPLSGSQKINLSRELERGYSVVLPDTASLEQVSHLYWWRVDPSTGETLGVAGSGAGNAATERLITERIYHGLVTFVAVTIVCSAAAGTVSAAHFPGLLTYGDCVGIALGMAVGAASGPRYVAGIGMWLGFTLAVLALSKVLDFYAGPPNWWREKP